MWSWLGINVGLPIVKYFIFPLIDKTWDKVEAWYASLHATKVAKKEANEAKDKMNKAQTAQEIDDAADDTLNGI